MKRNPRKLKWTKAFRKAAGKEMVVDSTLQFAARRNVPVRYDRDLVAKTLKAMERISEIRARRERVFYKKRMAGKRERDVAAARKLVEEQGHLLPRLRGSEKRQLALEGRTEADVDLSALRPRTKVFGKEIIRQKVTFSGDVVEEIEVDTVQSGWVEEEDGEELDGQEEEDLEGDVAMV